MVKLRDSMYVWKINTLLKSDLEVCLVITKSYKMLDFHIHHFLSIIKFGNFEALKSYTFLARQFLKSISDKNNVET